MTEIVAAADHRRRDARPRSAGRRDRRKRAHGSAARRSCSAWLWLGVAAVPRRLRRLPAVHPAATTDGRRRRRQLRLRAGRRLLVRQRPQRARRLRPLHLRRPHHADHQRRQHRHRARLRHRRRHARRLPRGWIDRVHLDLRRLRCSPSRRSSSPPSSSDGRPRCARATSRSSASASAGRATRGRSRSCSPCCRSPRSRASCGPRRSACRQREYVLAARSLGAKTPRVLFREILPNVVPALSRSLFTGVAVAPRRRGRPGVPRLQRRAAEASWGLMVAENREPSTRRGGPRCSPA